MAFNGREGGEITLATGVAMTKAYREQNPGQRKAHFFGRDILEALLAQEDCMGIRMYYGLNENEERELILVGADSHENDLTELVADISLPCPNVCDSASQLNG